MSFFRKRCFICEEKDHKEKLGKVVFGGFFVGDHTIFWFHPKCLSDVLCNPGLYPNSKIETAIEIRKKQKADLEKRKELCRKAKKECLDE
jgi:hypothetical protein